MKRKWTIRLALGLLVAGMLDLLSTYRAAPDLAFEANPVFVFFGPSWFSVITFKTISSLFSLFTFTAGLNILESRSARVKKYRGFQDTLSHLVFKRRVSVKELFLFGWPKDWIAVAGIGGITIGITIFTSGIFLCLSNTLGILRNFAHVTAFGIGVAAVGVSISLWLTYRFCQGYQQSRS